MTSQEEILEASLALNLKAVEQAEQEELIDSEKVLREAGVVR